MHGQVTFKFQNGESFTTPTPDPEVWEPMALRDHSKAPEWDHYFVRGAENHGGIYALKIKHAVDGSDFLVHFVTEESKCYLADFSDRMIEESALIEDLKLYIKKED